MENARIRKLSISLQGSVAVAFAALVVVTLGVILYRPGMEFIVKSNFGAISANGISMSKHLMLSALVLVSLAPTYRVLHMLWRLFSTYASGEVLSQTAAATLQSVGRAILVMGIVAFVAPTLATLILTYDNPEGTRQLSIHLSSNIYALFLFGGLITTIGWIMVEAARIDADNKAII